MVDEIWRDLLFSTNKLGETLVASHEIDDVISLMIEYKIDPQKFVGNLYALYRQGMPSIFNEDGSSLPTTSSISQYERVIDRPSTPLWFIASFPDVLAWVGEQDADLRRALRRAPATQDLFITAFAKLYGLNENSPDMSELENPDGTPHIRFYQNIISSYVSQTGSNLEVAVEEGSGAAS